jgi:hypothetical protein
VTERVLVCGTLGFCLVEVAALENKATKPGTGWYEIFGWRPNISCSLFGTSLPSTARERPTSLLEFEFSIAFLARNPAPALIACRMNPDE